MRDPQDGHGRPASGCDLALSPRMSHSSWSAFISAILALHSPVCSFGPQPKRLGAVGQPHVLAGSPFAYHHPSLDSSSAVSRGLGSVCPQAHHHVPRCLGFSAISSGTPPRPSSGP